MLGIIYNTPKKSCSKDNYNLDKAAEHIAKITQNTAKDSQQKK